MSTRAISICLIAQEIRYHHCNGYNVPDFDGGELYYDYYDMMKDAGKVGFAVMLIDKVLSEASGSDWEYIWLRTAGGEILYSKKTSASEVPENALATGWMGNEKNPYTGEYFYWAVWKMVS